MEWLFGKKKTPAGALFGPEISPRASPRAIPVLPPTHWVLTVATPRSAAELLRENKRMLDKAIRELDRERMGLQTQEKKLIMEIKKMAKEGQMVRAKRTAAAARRRPLPQLKAPPNSTHPSLRPARPAPFIPSRRRRSR